jgi:hypothetical protein
LDTLRFSMIILLLQNINARQAVTFAREHGRPLIKWKHRVKKGSGTGSSDERLVASFVAGAPAYLNKNISGEATELGIHNGTKCVLRAFGYSDAAQQRLANDSVLQSAVGDVVWVETPDYIVVEILESRDRASGSASAPRSPETGNLLFTLRPGEYVALNVLGTVDSSIVDAPSSTVTRLSSVTIQCFNVDLAWAIT